MSIDDLAIVGGAGFIGSCLAARLRSENVRFAIFDINTFSPIDSVNYLDVEDRQTLKQLRGSAAIINLAAVHRDDVKPLSRYDDVNVKGAENICEAARQYGINKIIFTSSVAIYGFAPANTNESGEANYFNDYGRTKFLAEGVYRKWLEEDPSNRTLVIVRPTVVFGEGNRGNVFNLLRQIASRRFVMIGDGTNRKSMAYVENVAAFLEYSLSLTPGLHIYNYVDKPDLDMNTLVAETRRTLFGRKNVGLRLPEILGVGIGYTGDIIAKIVGRSLPVSSIRVKKFVSTTQFASSVDQTGFVPPISLEDGLARTLRYEFLDDNADKHTFDTE